MVNYLLLQRDKPQVGKNWITRLIKRRPEIDSKFARKYNYERAKCEDPKIIQEHFDRVRDAISEYGILPEDIYNFDETGFAMGLCATAKVITGSDRYARPKLLQPGNREWVTAIEATNSTGWAIPSYIIFKAKKNVRLGWFDNLPSDWRINISEHGWTTDQIGLEWLKTHFIPSINGRSGSQALTENVRHVKIFPSTGQALSMTPKDNTLGKCIRDTIPRAVPTLPSKPRTYGNGTRSSLTSTETVLNVRRN
ncbi:conserved hypothetical protein [Talaromyces marneffei ATCC 18224]|uniref:DDE-1 domain-containing protein n=1 Tax=Talaromyces marneffei (strain ATCC 18224 / CBS 334.59 / QM 7333) TaxID=441960 RepID=B6QHY3_TALMQ|nr:conserved hypothetical protein [Talaromyces marneffei ATCC 18224]